MIKVPERYKLSKNADYLSVSLDQFKIIGRSIAGVETVFTIPQFKLSLDIGRAPQFSFGQPFLALTHLHLDHAGGLLFDLGLRTLNGLAAQKIIVPDGKVKGLQDCLAAVKKLTESELKFEILPASQTYQLKPNLFLKAVASDHCTESTGYGVYAKRHHLKAEFKDKTQAEIVKAKQKGFVVNEESHDLLLAFSGDSRGEFLTGEACEAKTLIMECSFFGDDCDYASVRKYGHTHINDWVKYADQIQSQNVIMSHTSQRYTSAEIHRFCQKMLPRDLLKRLIVFR